MTYRLEIDIAHNVRARKGERREKGTGRLIKAQIHFGTLEQITADYAATVAGGSEILTHRVYNLAVYNAWVKNGGVMPNAEKLAL